MLNFRLLQILLETSEHATVLALSHAIGVEISLVKKTITQLKEFGCIFDYHPQLGIKLLQAGLGVWQDYLEYILDGVKNADENSVTLQNTNKRIIKIYNQTSSTQDLAKEIVKVSGAKSNSALIIASTQTAGRGRMGRKWVAPKDSAATFSRIYLPDNFESNTNISVDRITFAVSVAVARALDSFLKIKNLCTQIYWPNDLMVRGKKIGGILVENCTPSNNTKAAIIGIGINTALLTDDLSNDKHLQDKVTSFSLNNIDVDRLALIAQINLELDKVLAKQDINPLLDEWKERCAMMRKEVSLLNNGLKVHGEVIDIHPYEGLVVRGEAGELVHLPAATTTKMAVGA